MMQLREEVVQHILFGKNSHHLSEQPIGFLVFGVFSKFIVRLVSEAQRPEAHDYSTVSFVEVHIAENLWNTPRILSSPHARRNETSPI